MQSIRARSKEERQQLQLLILNFIFLISLLPLFVEPSVVRLPDLYLARS